MKNLDELMKHADKLKYTKKQKKELIEQVYSVLGETTYLTICNEEMSELIEVTTEAINNKVDYIHMAEELVDVEICTNVLKVLFNIKDSELEKVDKKKKKKKSVIINSIMILTKSQQNISKIIREKDGARDKIKSTIENMNEATVILQDIFKIKRKDMDKIEALKYKRLEDRIIQGTLH